MTTAGGTVELAETDRLAPAAPSTEAPATVTGKFRIAGDTVKRAIFGLDEDQRAAIWWLYQYCRTADISHADVAAQLKKPTGAPYSPDSVYAALTGRRQDSSLEPFCDAIKRLRRVVDDRAGQVETGFIETAISRAMFRVFRSALLRRRLTFIFGESQVGKTSAAEEYARLHNHGETILVRMPTRGCLGELMQEMAARLGIPTHQKHGDLRRRILDCFDEHTLLIVDEFHQVFASTYSNRSLASLEFLREIHDRRKCGLVLIGTNIGRQAIIKGPQRHMLRQLWLRAYSPLQLPDIPSKRDLATFAKAYGLDSAPDQTITAKWRDDDDQEQSIRDNPATLQTAVITEHGLGRWLAILQEASDEARSEAKRISWGRVLKTHANFKSMETPES